MASKERIPSDWFEHIVNLANEGIWTVDANSRTNYINERGAAILGYAPEEMIGRAPSEFMFLEDWPTMDVTPEEFDGRIRQEGIMFRARRKDGSAVWISSSTSPVIAEDGSFQGSVAVFSDVTDRKSAEESSAFQAHLLSSVHDAIVATDEGFSIIYWNKMAERMFGWTVEEVIGRHAGKILRPKVQGISPEELVERTMREGFFDSEAICRHKDGHEICADIHASVVRDEDGRVREYVGSLRDISSRKAAERALRRSEEEYRLLVQYAPTAIFELDLVNMRFRKVNDAMTDLTGYTQEELLTMGPLDFLDEKGGERFKQRVSERLAGRLWNDATEYMIRGKDCRERWMVFNLKPIYENGKTTGALVIGYDDTERWAISEALKESEERLRTIIDNSRDGIYMFDLGLNRFIFVSPSQVEITGFTAEEMKALTSEEAFDRVHPDDRELVREYDDRVISGNDSGEPAEYRWMVKRGEYRWLSERRRLIKDESGRPVAMVGTSRDITERKREEQALLMSEERLTLALSAGHMGIWDWIVKTDVSVWNDESFRMLGYRVGEVRPGLNAWADRIHPQDKDWMWAKFESALKMGDDFSAEFRVLWPDGTVRWIYALGGLERDRRGEAVRTYGVMMDITDRKNVEKELARYSGELERSNAELQQFAYVASHDLQEPLRMVTLYMDLLSSRHRDEMSVEAAAYIGIAMEGAERMRQLVNDLLEYSRVETKAGEFEEVDLDRVAARVRDELRLTIEDAHATVIIEPLPTVLGDEVQMRQLLTNLMANAIKFRRLDEAPVVELSARDRGNKWLFAVKDNGIGIELRHQEKLFKMFQRLNSRDEYPGTGIGLAICKKIVERHGGQIWVESDGKSGSTFYFTLPKS